MYRTLKLGLIGALIVLTVLGLLWVTEAIPRDDVAAMAPKALGAIVILILAAAAYSMLRGGSHQPDRTDKPVP